MLSRVPPSSTRRHSSSASNNTSHRASHLPRKYYQRVRVPRLPGTTGCNAFWVYSTRLCLRHVGDVTVVLSKRGRNLGPKQTKILVTNLDERTPRQVVGAYQRRWPVEIV